MHLWYDELIKSLLPNQHAHLCCLLLLFLSSILGSTRIALLPYLLPQECILCRLNHTYFGTELFSLPQVERDHIIAAWYGDVDSSINM